MPARTIQEIDGSYDWNQIETAFETVFKDAFANSKKAHFDNVPNEFKVVDGAKSKWCKLILMDAIIFFLTEDKISASSRRSFSQEKLFSSCVLNEWSRIEKTGEDVSLEYMLLNNKITLKALNFPWDSIEHLRNTLLASTPTRSRQKYLTITDILCLHPSLEEKKFCLLIIFQEAIRKVLQIHLKSTQMLSKEQKNNIQSQYQTWEYKHPYSAGLDSNLAKRSRKEHSGNESSNHSKAKSLKRNNFQSEAKNSISCDGPASVCYGILSNGMVHACAIPYPYTADVNYCNHNENGRVIGYSNIFPSPFAFVDTSTYSNTQVCPQYIRRPPEPLTTMDFHDPIILRRNTYNLMEDWDTTLEMNESNHSAGEDFRLNDATDITESESVNSKIDRSLLDSFPLDITTTDLLLPKSEYYSARDSNSNRKDFQYSLQEVVDFLHGEEDLNFIDDGDY